MDITDILERLKELKYEPDRTEIVVNNSELQELRTYIELLEKQNRTLTKERNSYFQELTEVLRAKPYIKFDTRG